MRKRYHGLWLFAGALILIFTFAMAQAQVPKVLLLEADPLPDNPALVISGINNSAVNHAGGFAFTVNTSDGTSTISLAWGDALGGPGMIIRTEGTFGIYEQTSWESFFGFGNVGQVAYSPLSTNLDTGTTGLDGVWLDDMIINIEEEVYPHDAGFWWSFGSRPGVTADGNPYFVGGITDTQGGSTVNRGLFYGPTAAPVLLGGGFVGGLPDPLDTASTVSFDYRYSALGSHYIAEVQTLTGSTTNNNHMVSNGNVIEIAGQPVSEASPIPMEAGGMGGENWDNFDYAGITESGDYMFTGDTDGDTGSDEYVLKNGVITYREGMTLDGEVLSGSIEGAYMNEDGDVAFIWDIVDGTSTIEALYLEDNLLLKEGDPVDLDGDGNPDLNAVIDVFTGISALTMSDRNGDGMIHLYFTADLNITGFAKQAPLARGGADPVPADAEAAGLGQEDLISLSSPQVEPDRAILEAALVLSVPAVVPVFLASFDVAPVESGVDISWSVTTSGDPGEFLLMAQQGDSEWEVGYTLADDRFVAQDDRPSDGSVTYSLYHRHQGRDWTQLGQQTVTVQLPDLVTQLKGASPNPFNPHTDIAFSLARTQQVRISLYDMAGNLVTVLAEDIYAQGSHSIAWDGKDASGRGAASGTYVVRLETAQEMDSQKIMLVR